jgi:hypothetical protein
MMKAGVFRRITVFLLSNVHLAPQYRAKLETRVISKRSGTNPCRHA